MKRLILSLLAVCLLWMANAQNPAWGPQSKVVTDSIYSQVLKAHRAYTIYLPQSYSNETDRKYPILYLLHGMSGVNTSWFTDQRVKDVMDQVGGIGRGLRDDYRQPQCRRQSGYLLERLLQHAGLGLRRFLL